MRNMRIRYSARVCITLYTHYNNIILLSYYCHYRIVDGARTGLYSGTHSRGPLHTLLTHHTPTPLLYARSNGRMSYFFFFVRFLVKIIEVYIIASIYTYFILLKPCSSNSDSTHTRTHII